ncbi:MAG: MFS transporter [Planctomycetia bacterium]|nr:MFS transporter [Planctomycetia bacterium]
MASATQSLEHPLSVAQQTRNVIVFAACTGLQYLAAPVLYVGMTQASLCKRLGASPVVANLPEMAFFVMTVAPVVLAWWFPGVALLRRMMSICYLSAGLALGIVAVVLVAPVSNDVKIAAVILQGLVSGASMPTAIALLWEAVGRGVPEARRGQALGLAFGLGPFLAFAASLLSQELLSGRLWGLLSQPLEAPWNFVAVFGGTAPLMIAAAALSPLLTIPPADVENETSEPFIGGLIRFLSTPILAKATVVTILLYIGNTITANMNLQTENLLSEAAENYVGYQNALRFFCKGIAGLLLGWMLTRSNPRAGILITGLLFVASQAWAIFVPGKAYLFAFGIYGAGELVGVYAPNYILSASAPGRIRQNMAYVTMMMAPAAPAGYLFGAIASGTADPAAGFRLSFIICAAILVVGLVLAVALLPRWPAPAVSLNRDPHADCVSDVPES